jgi:hypothetical protein
MMDHRKSETLMLVREAGHVIRLKTNLGDVLNEAVLAAMVELYRTGWRDCWEAHTNEDAPQP